MSRTVQLRDQPVSEPVLTERWAPDTALSVALHLLRGSGRCHWITTTGESMEPLIRGGDRVLVRMVHKGIRRGSIVVTYHDGQLTAHRVIRFQPAALPHLLTKGDNAERCDPPVIEYSVIGTVLAVQRGEQYVDIDTGVWRLTGWVIASITLGWLAVRSVIALSQMSTQSLPLAIVRGLQRKAIKIVKVLVTATLTLERIH